MKLNEFRKTQNIENDYVFISDDGKVDFEDEKEFEIQEILKKENNANCIYIQIDEFKKKRRRKKNKRRRRKKRIEGEKKKSEKEEKKALNEEIKL